MDFVEIFHVLLDVSSIYFILFEGSCSFISSCYSVLEHYSLFSEVKLSISHSLLFLKHRRENNVNILPVDPGTSEFQTKI